MSQVTSRMKRYMGIVRMERSVYGDGVGFYHSVQEYCLSLQPAPVHSNLPPASQTTLSGLQNSALVVCHLTRLLQLSFSLQTPIAPSAWRTSLVQHTVWLLIFRQSPVYGCMPRNSYGTPSTPEFSGGYGPLVKPGWQPVWLANC